VVSDAQLHVRQAITNVLLDAGLQPPDVNALAAATRATGPVVQQALMALARERQVVKLADLWFHADVLAGLRDQVRALGAGTVFDVAAAKARFGVSRKFAIPLLEHLDRERITRRVGDKRLVL
jgi:selenocysteine-specific elongation factor